MRNCLFFSILFILSSCDYTKCDLTIINSTGYQLYFYVHPLHKEDSWSYNVAYMQNISNDPKYAEKYFDYENNPYGLGIGDTVVDCIVNTSFRKFSREYGGLTITSYLREKIEAKLPGDSLQASDIYKSINLTVGELEQLNYKVIIK